MEGGNLKGRFAATLKPTLSILLVLAAAGCISRSAYEGDMQTLYTQLQNERVANAAKIKALEIRLQERAKSLAELTNRYMTLEKDKEQAQIKINNLKGDFESLLRDMAELRLVIDSNIKGSGAAEMKLKLADMQNRIINLLGKQNPITQ